MLARSANIWPTLPVGGFLRDGFSKKRFLLGVRAGPSLRAPAFVFSATVFFFGRGAILGRASAQEVTTTRSRTYACIGLRVYRTAACSLLPLSGQRAMRSHPREARVRRTCDRAYPRNRRRREWRRGRHQDAPVLVSLYGVARRGAAPLLSSFSFYFLRPRNSTPPRPVPPHLNPAPSRGKSHPRACKQIRPEIFARFRSKKKTSAIGTYASKCRVGAYGCGNGNV